MGFAIGNETGEKTARSPGVDRSSAIQTSTYEYENRAIPENLARFPGHKVWRACSVTRQPRLRARLVFGRKTFIPKIALALSLVSVTPWPRTRNVGVGNIGFVELTTITFTC